MDRDLYQRLSWLEEELLDEEYEEYENYEDLSHLDVEDIIEEFSEPQEPPRRLAKRNRAAYFDRAQYADEEFDESTALLVERKKTGQAKREKQPKRKGIGDLVFLACLELAGILAVIWWWMRWLI